MSVALALAGYAVLLAVAGPWLLRRGWADRAPRLAVAAWQALTASAVAAVVIGAFVLAVPTATVSVNVAHLLEACAVALRAQYSTPGGAAVASSAAVLAVAVAGRVAWCSAAELVRAGRMRRRHREALALIGRPYPRLGAMVVDHPAPAAYCLPGRHRRIVLTTAALAALDDDQLRAVLAHEKAHLRGRHDLVTVWALTLRRAFPRVRLFRIAKDEIERLVELLADDAATRTTPRLTLAEALLTMGDGARPAAALAAGGTAAAARIRRLIAAPRPMSRVHKWLGGAAVVAALALPALLLTGAAATAMPQNSCDRPMDCPSATVDCPLVTSTRHDCPSA